MTSFMRLLRSVAQKHGLCVLVSILSLVCSYPRPIWTVRPVEMAWCANQRAVHAGTERRDGGRASGSRRVLHIFDRCDGVARAFTGARSRDADSTSAPLTRIGAYTSPRSSLECINSQSLLGDRGALFVSDTAWESAGDLRFDEKYSDFSPGNRLCFLAYVASTRSPPFGSKSLTFVW